MPSRLTRRSAQLATLAAVAIAAACAPASAAPAVVVTETGTAFAQRPGVQLRLDMQRLRDVSRAPIVLLLHGGGWWYGTRADLMGKLTPVAASFVRSGYVTVGIDYRLACGHGPTPRMRYGIDYTRGSAMCGAHIPDQVADVHDAIRFARANAERWNADPDRIVLLGASAGGHLAMLAAATAPADARVRAVANWSGPTSTEFILRQNPRRRPSIMASYTNAVGCMWSANRSCQSRWYASSPLRRIGPRSPRFAVISVGGLYEPQVPAASFSILDARLRRLGGFTTRTIAVPNDCHGSGCRSYKVRSKRGRFQSIEHATIAFLTSTSRAPRS